jgi:hypothetical protein
MKRIILIAGIVTMSLSASVTCAQTSCKVLLPRISDSYTGSCKQGLANGQGEAFGIDQYKGEFKKGFPDGVGIYFWQTGETYNGEWKRGLREGDGKYTFKYMGRDSVIVGVWKEDKYIGERDLASYVIEYRNSIGRVTCMRVGDRPYVKYKFSPNGGESNNISNLLMQGTSGSESNTASFSGFEQVTFPFKGKVTFTAPNSFMTSVLSCELRFVINEPGSWIVTMFY